MVECTCNCMDCIEGRHCGRGESNPDGTLTVCHFVPDCDDDDREPCPTCGGDGWGIVGCDWDSDDYINGPYDGEITRCPNCGGSGNAEDCTYW